MQYLQVKIVYPHNLSDSFAIQYGYISDYVYYHDVIESRIYIPATLYSTL